MVMHKALHSRDDIDTCQEKKEKEVSPRLMIASIQRYKDSKGT